MLTYQAHSSPIGMVFYMGAQFPAEYRNDAFVAMRGSWNRNPPTGYKVVRIRFENGKPTRIEDFLTGFLIENGRAHFGRLAGIAGAGDGSLLVADDTNGVIYRVSYTSNTGGSR
ncbi:MAG: PQQ-dependent sugar dehydrogenase [Pyrinomonadaceae bacterium]